MENFSNVEDNTLLFQVDETVTNKLDPFNNEIEIQNFKNQSHFTNLSMNNFYSTCFYTENYQVSEDFSFVFNHEDFKIQNKADTLYKKIRKFNKKIESTKKISGKTQPEKFFFIFKKHTIGCKHKNRKIQRNKIKNLIEKDFLLIFDKKVFNKYRFSEFLQINENTLNNLDITNYSNISNFSFDSINKNEHYKIKKTTNRNFRLFDKDVMIKKIMSNFLKFLKIVLEIFISKVLNIRNIKIKDFDPVIFYTFDQCKEFLEKKNFSDYFDIASYKISKCQINKYRFLLRSNMFLIFSEFFLNSTYFFEYLIDKIKSKYDNFYFSCFMNYAKKIIS
jgi:hypothetical protein